MNKCLIDTFIFRHIFFEGEQEKLFIIELTKFRILISDFENILDHFTMDLFFGKT